MIRAIKLNPAISGRIGGRTDIEFSPGVNLLIGPNGSGKSSILTAIRDKQGEVFGDSSPVMYFAAEGVQAKSTAFGAKSHGETMLGELSGLANINHECTILLDEPEQALSLDAVSDLCKTLAAQSAGGKVQYIISTHHPLIWTLKGANLVHLTDPKWMKGHIRTLVSRLSKL